MFRSSLFLKTFSTIVTGIVILAVVYYIFTVPMINSMAFEMEERAGQNVLDNMYLLVKQSHSDLESWRESATKGHKRELKSIVNIVESYIRDVQKDIAENRIGLAEGQRLVLKRIRTLKYGNNDYVWVSDYNSRLISHPDPKLHESDFSKIKDVRGNLIVPPMVQGALTKGEGYYSYWWRRLGREEPVEKLSYYRNISEWKWVIGTGVYMDDITTAYEKRRKELITELRKHLHTIRIGGEGYLYIFDSGMNMIIHPNPNIENTNFADLLNPVTQKPIGRELIATADTKDRKFDYKWDKPSDPGNYVYDKISWIRYFKGTDWYLCSSVYTDDLKRSANALTNRIVLVSIIALILSIIGGYFFVHTFTSPIKRLATTANRISKGDLTTAPTRFNRKDEIGVLASAFNNMVDQLRDQIRNLEVRVSERTAELSGRVSELKRRNLEIETINSMGDMLQSAKTYDEIYSIIVKTVRSLFEGCSGHLMVRDGHSRNMKEYISWNGGIRDGENRLYAINDCWSIRRGRIYMMNNSDFNQVCRHAEDSTGKTPPYLCVPIMVQDEISGVLHIKPFCDALEGQQGVDENTRRLAASVAEHASLSLANLKLRNSLHEQSVRDVLTGLHNRRYAEEALQREQHRAARHGISIGVLFLDVDFFKKINDTYGHDAGDEVLRRLGTILDNEFREEDSACRYGGEEFMIILPYADLKACMGRAERLRKSIEQNLKIPWQGELLKITVSIGTALFPDQGSDMQQVVEAADAALLVAKQQGRNQVVQAPV